MRHFIILNGQHFQVSRTQRQHRITLNKKRFAANAIRDLLWDIREANPEADVKVYLSLS